MEDFFFAVCVYAVCVQFLLGGILAQIKTNTCNEFTN